MVERRGERESKPINLSFNQNPGILACLTGETLLNISLIIWTGKFVFLPLIYHRFSKKEEQLGREWLHCLLKLYTIDNSIENMYFSVGFFLFLFFCTYCKRNRMFYFSNFVFFRAAATSMWDKLYRLPI